MKVIINATVLISLLLLVGCDKDRSLNPPVDSKKITFSMRLPSGVEALPLNVMYRSTVCNQVRKNAQEDSYDVPGFNLVEMPLIPIKNNGLFESDIPLDGGGECSWMLSNITVSFKYTDTKVFPENIVKNNPAKTIFTFDDRMPQVTNGTFDVINGVGEIIDDYYPVITTFHRPKESVVLSLRREKLYSYYKVIGVSEIKFTPVIHTNKAVKAFQPKNNTGEYFKIVYPDGMVTSKPYFPDFGKLKEM